MLNCIEYAVFSVMMISSVLVGIYYGCIKKQNTVKEYMQGGKKMAVFPVTMSLIASHVSGISLLGLPAEVYTYGTQFLASTISIFFTLLFILAVVLPVFFKLQLTSTYQYLELRFNRSCRMLASFIFTLSLVLVIPIIMYIPALAVNQVAGLQVQITTPVICIICIFYTTFGGLKAVVWTDTIQSIFTMAALVLVVIIGCKNQGISEVLRINEEGHRLELFNMDPSPFARNTFWTTVVGFFFVWLGIIAFHPGALQRFTAVPTYSDARLVTIWSSVGFMGIKIFCGVLGLLIYGKYYNCDPIATNTVHKSGQLVLYYIMNSARQYPGITGLFISGIVSAALGVMSAGLNTAAGTLYQDYAHIFLKGEKQSESKAARIMKLTALILGCISVLLLFVVDRFDSLVQITMSVIGTTNGSIISMFMLGLFFPWTNAKGAMIGGLTSLVVMCWIVIGAQLSISQGKLSFPGKVTSVENCPSNITRQLNATQRVQTYTGVGSPVIVSDDVFLIYQISYGNYCMVGMIIGVVVGIVVSLLTEPQDLKTLNSDLIAPVLHRFLPKNCKPKKFKGVNSVVNYSVSLNAEFKPKNYNSPKLPD